MKVNILFLILLFCAFCAAGQNTYLPSGSDEVHLVERLETMSGKLSNELLLGNKPVSRKAIVQFIQDEKSNHINNKFSNVDYHNMNRALSLSGEWERPLGDGARDAQHPVLKHFYKKESDFVHVQNDDWLLVINPMLSGHLFYEMDKGKGAFYTSTQGAEIRGRYKRGIGFYLSLAHNLDKPVSYINDWANARSVMPGAGGFTKLNNGFSYWKYRGYIDVPLVKDNVNLTVGYDQHFIGDGYRSLFLSDFAEGAAFARISTKIWRLQYQNLYLMLRPQRFAGDMPSRSEKYATIHNLSVNVTKWLNLGLFESVTFGRDDHFEFSYLNPIIFYRGVERAMGSPDKVSIGINGKAIFLKQFSVYTQLLINEFTSKEIFAGRGYWANKWGWQIGVKQFDAFGIPNLDLQAEANVVRPYTFQHYANLNGHGIANYTHYNQELAHPLGAGFYELTGIMRYQPIPRLTLNAKAAFFKQGIDTAGSNMGSNLFMDYNTRPNGLIYGVGLIHGPEATTVMLNLYASYELRPRLYFEIEGAFRRITVIDKILPEQRSIYFGAGFRLNLNRRDMTQF